MGRATKPDDAFFDEAEAKPAKAKVPSKIEGFDFAKELGWAKPRDVLVPIRAVPTIFPQYDFVSGIGGHPLDRVVVVTGPSNHGKTIFCLGLIKSFIDGQHIAGLADVERTTTVDWVDSLLDASAKSSRLVALRPSTFEDMVEKARSFCNGVQRMREKGKLVENAGGLIVVDSMRKLVPQKILEIIEKEAVQKGNIDGMSGRAAQIKAMFNAAWLDELVPMLSDTGCSIVCIARESEKLDAKPWEKKSGQDFKITGGKALIFDSSLVLRITRKGWVQKANAKADGSFAKSDVYGERHAITVIKTKVAGKEDKQPVAYFHTSNGKLLPAGFDRARDLFELGIAFDLIKKNGAQFSLAGEHLGAGEHKSVVKLHEHPDMLATLDKDVRALFKDREPQLETGEVDEEPLPWEA